MLPGQQSAQPSAKAPLGITKTVLMASSRQKPHRGDGLQQEQPSPPVVHYSEPAPPQDTPVTRFSRCPIERPFRRSRSWKGVTLEALPAPEEQRHAYHSEDSDFSSSGGSDAEKGGHNATNARLAAESQVVQQRIDECKAAICRHKMTIEMLQHAVAQDAEALDQDEPLRSTRRSSPARRPANNPDPVVVPAVIQDRVARLRRRCVEGLGGERFELARQCLQQLASAESQSPVQARDRMLDVLGQEMIGFYALLDQIVHLEQRWRAPPPAAVDLQVGPGARAALDESLFGRWPSGMSSVYSTARSRWHSESAAEFF